MSLLQLLICASFYFFSVYISPAAIFFTIQIFFMNIFVGNLSIQTTENQLRDAFAEFGRVDTAKIIIDRYTNQSRGFGFVEMPDSVEANAAIEKLNSSFMDQSVIVVNEAMPRTDSRSGGGGYNGGFKKKEYSRRY